MKLIRKSKYKYSFSFVTTIVIIAAFLCQNIAWAQGSRMLMPDYKRIMDEEISAAIDELLRLEGSQSGRFENHGNLSKGSSKFALRLLNLGVAELTPQGVLKIGPELSNWMAKQLKRVTPKPKELLIVILNLSIRIHRETRTIERITDGDLVEIYRRGKFIRRQKENLVPNTALPVLKYKVFPLFGEYGVKIGRLTESETRYKENFIARPLKLAFKRISAEKPVWAFTNSIANNLIRLQEASLRDLANKGIIPRGVFTRLLSRLPLPDEQLDLLARNLNGIILAYQQAGYSQSAQAVLLSRFITVTEIGYFMTKHQITSLADAINILCKYTWSDTVPDAAIALADSLVSRHGITRSKALYYVGTNEDPEQAAIATLELAQGMHERHKEKRQHRPRQKKKYEVPFSDALWFAEKYDLSQAEAVFTKALEEVERFMGAFNVSYTRAMYYLKTYGVNKAGENLEMALAKAKKIHLRVNRGRPPERRISASDIADLMRSRQRGIEDRVRRVLRHIDEMMDSHNLSFRDAVRVAKKEMTLAGAISKNGSKGSEDPADGPEASPGGKSEQEDREGVTFEINDMSLVIAAAIFSGWLLAGISGAILAIIILLLWFYRDLIWKRRAEPVLTPVTIVESTPIHGLTVEPDTVEAEKEEPKIKIETAHPPPAELPVEEPLTGGDFFAVRKWITKGLVAPKDGIEPLRVDLNTINNMIIMMNRIVKRELDIDLVQELPARLRNSDSGFLLILSERSDSLFANPRPEADYVFKINRRALLIMQDLGVSPELISFLISVGFVYDQLFTTCFSNSLNKEDIDRVRLFIYRKLKKRYDLDIVMLSKVLELIGYSGQTFTNYPPDIVSLRSNLAKICVNLSARHPSHLEEAISRTTDLLREGRMESSNKLILRTVSYFQKVKEHNLFSSSEAIKAPAAIYWHQGAELRLVSELEVLDTVADIVVFPQGQLPASGKPFGLKHIRAQDGQIGRMEDREIIELAGRILSQGDSFDIERWRGAETYYVYRQGDDVYELRMSVEGYILSLHTVSRYRTALARRGVFSLAEADRLAIVINQEDMIYKLKRTAGATGDFYPQEAFFNEENKNEVYLIDNNSGEVIIVDRNGNYQDYFKGIDPAVLFAGLGCICISNSVLKGYQPRGDLIASWQEAGKKHETEVARLKGQGYDSKTAMALVSWLPEYREKKVLAAGIPEQVLLDYISRKIQEGRQVCPGSDQAPVRFYRLGNESIVVLPASGLRADPGWELALQTSPECWQRINQPEIQSRLNLLGETLVTGQPAVSENGVKARIYLKGDHYYLATVAHDEVIVFSRYPRHRLALCVELADCSYQAALRVSGILNGDILLELPLEQEAAIALIQGKDRAGDIIDRKVYYHRGAKIFHVVDWNSETCLLIDLAGNITFKSGINRRSYLKGGVLRKTKFHDLTHVVFDPTREEIRSHRSGNDPGRALEAAL